MQLTDPFFDQLYSPRAPIFPLAFLWRWAACRRRVAHPRTRPYGQTFPILWVEPWQVVNGATPW